jgi:ABC-type transport system involved in multi-copper enzyme maturation permease subunit
VSLRSTRWILAAFVVTGVVFGVVISAATGAHYPDASATTRAHWDPTNNTLAGLIPGYLIIPVLGVLMITSEHGSGSIRSTLAAVPRRHEVLLAKAVVFGVVAFVVDEVVTFAAFLGGQPVMGSAPNASLGQPGVVRALVLSGAFIALLGIFGLGLGAIVRNSGAAVAIYAGLALLVPDLFLALPGNAWRFGPITILANSVSATKLMPDVLSPGTGFAAMVVYTAVALGAGCYVLAHRDV